MANDILGHKPPKLLTDDDRRKLNEQGRQIVSDGHDEERPSDIAKIKAHAAAFAREVYTEEFDPNKHAHDSEREEANEQRKKRLEHRAMPATDYARTAVEELEIQLATRDLGLKKPAVLRWIRVVAVLALILTVGPTIHDQFFGTIGDDFLAWILSISFAAVIGAFVVLSMLDSAEVSAKRTLTNWVGLLAGVGIGLGAGALRVAFARTHGEYLFAGALTLVEISVVVGLEFVASGLRSEYRAWAEQEEELAPLRAKLAAAREQLARRQTEMDDLQAQIDSHVLYVEWRSLRHFKANDIESAAENEIQTGYQEQLAENYRRRTGSSVIRRVA